MRKNFHQLAKGLPQAASDRPVERFESWYYKQTTSVPSGTTARTGLAARWKRVLTVIPCFVRTPLGMSAFIQIVDNQKGYSRRYDIPGDAVTMSDSPFELRMAESAFRLDGMDLRLKDARGSVRAELRFGKLQPPARSPIGKLLRDPYAFIPFMHHHFGIASLDHDISGYIDINNGQAQERIDFSGGRGYLEKEWGQSLPSSWLRIQTNGFDPRLGSCSLSFSLARLNRWGFKFKGFLCFLLAGGREYRFTTFSGARIDLLEIGRNCIRVLFSDARYKVELLARNPRQLQDSSATASPLDDHRRYFLDDNADSQVRVVLKERNGPTEDIVFDATGLIVGTTMIGDLGDLRP